jgi:predicted HicB family RNase H-like nuclease
MATKIKEEKNIYTYRVTWSQEDSEYVGLCAEFPSLSWLADSPDAALNGIMEVVADVIADMQTNNEPIPEPIATKRYSGNFTVRIPPDVHREIAILAAEANISLNRFISYKLASR